MFCPGFYSVDLIYKFMQLSGRYNLRLHSLTALSRLPYSMYIAQIVFYAMVPA